MSRILVVDDDAVLLRTLRINLRARGHEVLLAASGRQALAAFLADDPELVVLDLGLPDLDGVEVLRRLKATIHCAGDRAVGPAAGRRQGGGPGRGADDYVSKPFNVDELMARVRAALRRASTEAEAPATLRSGGLVLDFAAHRAERDGVGVHLTPTEWRLLAELAAHEGRVVSHEDLLRAVWGPGYSREHHYLRVFANQIRRKIEPYPAAPRHLINEPGLGYRLQP